MSEPTLPRAGTPPASGLQVRLATAADVRPALDMLSACVREMRRLGIDQWDEVYPGEGTFEADVQAGTLYVATDSAGGIVGCLVLNTHQDPEYAEVAWHETDGPIGVVHRLMVSPRAQGQGLATGLMRFAEARAAELGFRALRLDAFTGNPAALRLYHRLGYREAGAVRFRKGVFQCFEKRLDVRG